MRIVTVLLPLVFLVACSGKVGDTSNANADAGSGGDGGADGGTQNVADHRAQGVTCASTPVGPEPVIFDAGLPSGTRFDCQKNEDCTAHTGGRCVYTFQQEADAPPNGNLGTRCLYDACAIDSDCPSSSVCQCGSGGNSPNTCGPIGDCRIDTDCASGFCSPSRDGCAVPNGYFCHTPADQCSNDADCEGQGGLSAKCIVDPSTKAWVCQEIGCASAG